MVWIIQIEMIINFFIDFIKTFNEYKIMGMCVFL